MRKMRWVKEKSFEGLACSDCGWVLSNPRFTTARDLKEYRAEAKAKFDSHVCAKYPRKPRKKEC
jgi:hypothetical protein